MLLFTWLKKKYIVPQHDYQPFHWLLEFSDIIHENQGFDIIVGNPPYVEKAKVNYCLQFQLLSCGSTYAYFIERSLSLLKPHGKLGYIVPISGVSTPRMSPLVEHMMSKCSNISISNYDDRPSKIFMGLQDCRSSIFICTVSPPPPASPTTSTCTVHTTGYTRWNNIDRPNLFVNIIKQSIDSSQFVLDPRLGKIIPKLANQQEIKILNKLLAKSSSIAQYVRKNTQSQPDDCYPVYYHNTPRYWIHATASEIKSERIIGDEHRFELSAQLKSLYCDSANIKIVIVALLNSSLFYWWYVKISDGRHLTDLNIKQFPIDINSIIQNKTMFNKLSQLVPRLLTDYKNHIRYQKYDREGGMLIIPEYRPRHSKHIIDKIDDLFGSHYNFTASERTFIKQFDVAFRCS